AEPSGHGADVPGLDALAIGAAAVTALLVGVVAGFGDAQHAVPADVVHARIAGVSAVTAVLPRVDRPVLEAAVEGIFHALVRGAGGDERERERERDEAGEVRHSSRLPPDRPGVQPWWTEVQEPCSLRSELRAARRRPRRSGSCRDRLRDLVSSFRP